MTIADEIKKDYQYCFKRIKIKRRLQAPEGAAYYEADWHDISSLVLAIDNVTWNIDDVELNVFTQGGFGLTCKNDNFEFAPESISSSLFSTFLTRHKTKVKIEAGYIDENGVEYSYDVAAGLIVGDEISCQSNGQIYLPCIAPSSIFDEAPADYVNEGTNPDGTTNWYNGIAIDQVVDALYKLKISAVAMFEPILEGAIITPGNNIVGDDYDFSDWSCKDALDKMAEASLSAHYVGADFKLNFVSKEPSAAVQFTFNGLGVKGEDVNILSASDYNEGLRNTFNRFAWYQSDPLVQAAEDFVPGDSSSSWKYGVRSKSIDNRIVTATATRQAILDALLVAHKDPKEEIVIETKFVPQLKLLDRVQLNYYGDKLLSNSSLWGVALWGVAVWSGRRGGIKISKEMKIIRIEHDVMTFKSKLTLRAL